MAPEQEPVTPEGSYLDRRAIIRGMGLGFAGLSTLGLSGLLRGVSGTGEAQSYNSDTFRPAIGRGDENVRGPPGKIHGPC